VRERVRVEMRNKPSESRTCGGRGETGRGTACEPLAGRGEMAGVKRNERRVRLERRKR
jgi:hypothetical protein